MSSKSDITWTGVFRIYWNTDRDKPRVWSIDRGYSGSELNVRKINLEGVVAKTFFRVANKWPLPKGWLEGRGTVRITKAGVATIRKAR